MGYFVYTRERVGSDATRYKFREDAKLFGCNEGFIPWLHEGKVPKGQEAPWRWHIDVRVGLDDPTNEPSYKNCSLIIDLKPAQKETNLSLYEILDIWGFSMRSWTPILLRLAGLFVDNEDPIAIKQRLNFLLPDDRIESPIYEFLYISGGVHQGELTGQWTPPSPGPTNAALLWPEPLRYFMDCISEANPEI